MKLVNQLDTNGCGIACVACILGLSYTKTKQSFLDMKNSKPYTTGYDLIRLIKESSAYKTGRVIDVDNWKDIPDLAIVGINYNKRIHNWHWVVFNKSENRFYDSAYPKPRHDFGRVHPFCYIAIYK
jgi:hypothetical protein